MKTRLLVSILAALGVVGVWAVLTRRPEHRPPPADSRWLMDEGPPVLRMYDVTDLIDAQVEFSRSMGDDGGAPEAAARALVVMVRTWINKQEIDCKAGRLIVRAPPPNQNIVAARLAHLRVAIDRSNGRIE